ncbi:hypothetical protein FQR65_LT02159 [Abscondita terminalis]|nr:hypothetical protein FQR65_LT02159 [Abscondita terminalis]
MKFVYLIFVFAFVFGNTLAQKNVDDSSGESSEVSVKFNLYKPKINILYLKSMSADDNAKADNGQANFIDHMVLNRARK